ncbi:MAG: hypothetical protein U0270_08150 [Labilithrix sp.]
MPLESFSESKPNWIGRTIFITSIVLHAGAAVGLLIWSVFHVEELPPPEVTLTFFNAPPPPPPPPPPAGNSQKKSTPKKTTIVPKIPNPNSLKEPKKVEKDEPKEESHGEPGGVPGGVAGGVAGGAVGGVVGGTPTAAPPPPPPAPAPPKMVPSFVFDKERLTAPDPHLSDDYKNKHPKTTAQSRYRICVGQDGRVTEISTLQPLGGTEDDNVIRQIRGGWTWKPQPLPICTVRVFSFVIN